jgi:hypothetical protein
VVIAVVQTSMPDTSYRVRVSLAAESLSSPSYKSFVCLEIFFRIADIVH